MRRHYPCRVLSRQAGDVILPAGQSQSAVYINVHVWDAFELVMARGRESGFLPQYLLILSSHKEGARQGGLDKMCETKEGRVLERKWGHQGEKKLLDPEIYLTLRQSTRYIYLYLSN